MLISFLSLEFGVTQCYGLLPLINYDVVHILRRNGMQFGFVKYDKHLSGILT